MEVFRLINLSHQSIIIMLTLKKFDLKSQSWLDGVVEYKNTLLERMFPDLDIAIGDASEFLEKECLDLDGAIAAIDAGMTGYEIAGASGARKSGKVLFVRGADRDCFSRFFGSNSNCINYGSNLVTECRATFELGVTILVVQDGEYDTGDCHAKCSRDFAMGVVGNVQSPFQFRAAVKAKYSWVAKGTIAFSFDTGGYDLVLPVSCFKGNKVKPGVYNPKTLYFGVVHTAEVRHVKMSYSVTQYLPWSAVEADILPGTIAAAKHLRHIQTDIRALTEYLTAQPGIDCEEEEDSDRYISPVAEIVAADVHGQLIQHPWVVRHVKDMLAARWMRLATAGTVQFQSCMTQPDEGIPDGVCCIPHLPEGEVIVFPYPCRWKWDIAIWQNKHFPQWTGYEGVIVANAATLLTLGRDTDGDFLQFLPASKLPNVAAAVKTFGEPPELTKPKKEKVEGTLGEIAVRSMDNAVGLITYAIALAWAIGAHHYIPRLAQELQIEVDSLKNVQRADRKYIDDTLKAMGQHTVAWLKDRDSKDAFTTRPIDVSGSDTISKLAIAVNQIWSPLQAVERPLIQFRTLFPESPAAWRERAAMRRDEYQQRISAAAGDRKQIAKVIESLVESTATISDGKKMIAAAAFWYACHIQKSGTASLVFHAFKQQILTQLATPQFAKFTIVGTQHSSFAGFTWNGECYTVQVVNSEIFPDRQEIYIDDYLVGLLSNDSPRFESGKLLDICLHSYKQSIKAEVVA